MVLIAVMDRDKQPDRKAADGGTARVVATRRFGRPDEVGADVARRSIVVRNSWNPLLAPAGGYVWLLDPKEATAPSSPPVTVLPPLLDGQRNRSLQITPAVSCRIGMPLDPIFSELFSKPPSQRAPPAVGVCRALRPGGFGPIGCCSAKAFIHLCLSTISRR